MSRIKEIMELAALSYTTEQCHSIDVIAKYKAQYEYYREIVKIAESEMKRLADVALEIREERDLVKMREMRFHVGGYKCSGI